jgi:predicted aspartyl protease
LWTTALLSAVTLTGPVAVAATVEEFPVELRHGLLWVRVTVSQSTGPLNFLLDSGAAISTVNLGTAKRLGLNLGSRASVRGVGVATQGYWPTPFSAKAGTVSLPENCLAVDLSSLSDACGCGVDGLLGADFFIGRVVQIDFLAGEVRLLPSSAHAPDAEVLPLKKRRDVLRVPVRVNGGKTQWVRLDTGCASALEWVAAGARPALATAQVSIGLAEISTPVALTTVQLGGTSYDEVPTGWHQTEIFSGEGGLLGNGLLTRFERVTVDAKSGRLILEKPHPSN